MRIQDAAIRSRKTLLRRARQDPLVVAQRHGNSTARKAGKRQPPTVVALGLGTQKPVNDSFPYSSDGNSDSITGSISSGSSIRGRQEEVGRKEKNKGWSIVSKKSPT